VHAPRKQSAECLRGTSHKAAGARSTQVSWGIDLATEHERFLTEDLFKQPTIVYDYPKDIKAFYMKLNPDGKTVAAMDVLVPKVGPEACARRACCVDVGVHDDAGAVLDKMCGRMQGRQLRAEV